MTTVLIDEIAMALERLTPEQRAEIFTELRSYMSTRESTKRILFSVLHHDRDIARNEPWQPEQVK